MIAQHQGLARDGVRHVKRIEYRRNYIGSDISRESAAQAENRVHLPASDEFAGKAGGQPASAGPERQGVDAAGGEELRHVDRSHAFLAGQVIGIHCDAGAVLRVRVRAGAARLQILLNGVIHQQGKAGRISLLQAEVHGVVVVRAVGKHGNHCPVDIRKWAVGLLVEAL